MEKKIDEVLREEKANIIKEELFEEKPDSRPYNTLHETLLDNKTSLPVEALDNLETKNSEMKKKPRFSISLSPEEIEEDILLMTGSKPSKKLKKRDEAVQTELNKLFPGMRFASGSPDACHFGEEENKAMVDKVEEDMEFEAHKASKEAQPSRCKVDGETLKNYKAAPPLVERRLNPRFSRLKRTFSHQHAQIRHPRPSLDLRSFPI